MAGRGGTVLFVGTKKQARDTIAEAASAAGMPYVHQRWLGGLLTNFQTVSKRIKRLHELTDWTENGTLELLPTRERIAAEKERDKLEFNLGGVRNMQRPPDAMFVVDLKTEAIAIREAERLRIPIIGLVDTNCDPDPVTYVIPGNDDAIRSCKLIVEAIAGVVGEQNQRFRAEEEAARREARGAGAPRGRGAGAPGGRGAGTPRGGGAGPHARPRRPARPRPRRSARRAGAHGRRAAHLRPQRGGLSMSGEISAAAVKELRERTGAGMMDCKAALQEADGDMDKAIELLRVKGQAKAAKRGERAASEGLVHQLRAPQRQGRRAGGGRLRDGLRGAQRRVRRVRARGGVARGRRGPACTCPRRTCREDTREAELRVFKRAGGGRGQARGRSRRRSPRAG